MNRPYRIVSVILIVAVAVGSVYATTRYLFGGQNGVSLPTCVSSVALSYAPAQSPIDQRQVNLQSLQVPTGTLQVVAAENFWGSLVSQLGGNHTSVISIVTDPNADPHEYESNTADAQAIANAKLVIVNGAGYDDWALRLIAANGNGAQTVLNVAQLLGKKAGDNPHFWYGPLYVNETVHAIYSDLVMLDSSGSSYYAQQYSNLNQSISQNISGRIDEISQQFVGRRVASTESIFEYLAGAAKLDLISPSPFMQAVAEGNDPSPGCIALFQSQLLNPNSPGNATILVYNAQTVTPLTEQMKSEAVSHNIPIVPVTETIPMPNVSFPVWMGGELLQIQKALNATALGQ